MKCGRVCRFATNSASGDTSHWLAIHENFYSKRYKMSAKRLASQKQRSRGKRFSFPLQEKLTTSIAPVASHFDSYNKAHVNQKFPPPFLVKVVLRYARSIGVSTDVLIDDNLRLPQRAFTSDIGKALFNPQNRRE
jgi:hypothetical protein